jgi:hypothetical protein
MYLLVKNESIVGKGAFLEDLKITLVTLEKFKIKNIGKSWKFFANNTELPQSYSADVENGGYTLTEVWEDLRATTLARWLGYKIFQEL